MQGIKNISIKKIKKFITVNSTNKRKNNVICCIYNIHFAI